MLTRFSIRVTAVAIASGLVLALLAAWRADRRDRAQLAADLAAGRQALAQADARQHDRDTQLLQTLAALAAEKHAVTAPAQILRKLPQQIPLPVPLTLQAPDPMSKPQKGTCSSGPVCGPEGLEPARSNSNPSSKVAVALRP
jgi:multidrug efflux pump subunit AcrA (membrane-fusion protein)